MRVEAAFVVSAASVRDLPRDGLVELALVGRSNVGKSSLINALVGRRLARTSGAPGKTRLANIYRVTSGSGSPFYLVDLPGFGYARGDREELEVVTRAYFGCVGQVGSLGEVGPNRTNPRDRRDLPVAALLLIDARHPGLASDLQAWRWLESTVDRAAIVATKIDKLSRAERQRAMRTNDAVFEHPVLPVSAETGEGLDELWKLIDQLLSSSRPPSRNSRKASPMAAPDRPHPRKS